MAPVRAWTSRQPQWSPAVCATTPARSCPVTVAMPLTAAKSVTPSVRSRSGAVAWIVTAPAG